MTPELFLSSVLVPGLKFLTATVGPKPGVALSWEDDAPARLLMLAIPGIESLWSNVAQSGGGPGRGFYQDESETCGEVLNNRSSSVMMHKVCAALDIPATEAAIYAELLARPELQVALGRLDIWCSPQALPAYGDAHAGWLAYDQTWRPGDPHPAIWDSVYAQALAADKAYQAAQGMKA